MNESQKRIMDILLGIESLNHVTSKNEAKEIKKKLCIEIVEDIKLTLPEGKLKTFDGYMFGHKLGNNGTSESFIGVVSKNNSIHLAELGNTETVFNIFKYDEKYNCFDEDFPVYVFVFEYVHGLPLTNNFGGELAFITKNENKKNNN